MGTEFFRSMVKPPKIGGTGNINMEARAIGAPGYAARASAGAAQKDLGAAMAYRGSKYSGPTGTSAKAPGPKKV